MQNHKWQFFGLFMFSSLLTSLIIVIFPPIHNFLVNVLTKDVLYIAVAVGFIIPAIALFLLIGYSIKMGNSKFGSKIKTKPTSGMSIDDIPKLN